MIFRFLCVLLCIGRVSGQFGGPISDTATHGPALVATTGAPGTTGGHAENATTTMHHEAGAGGVTTVSLPPVNGTGLTTPSMLSGPLNLTAGAPMTTMAPGMTPAGAPNATLPPMTTMHPMNGTVPPMMNGTTMKPTGTPGLVNGTLPPLTTMHPMNGTGPPMPTMHPILNGTTMAAGTPGPPNGTLPPMPTMHPMNGTVPPMINGTTMAAGPPGPPNGTLLPMTTLHPMNGTMPPPLNGTLPPMPTMHPILNGTTMGAGTPGPLNATMPPMTTLHPILDGNTVKPTGTSGPLNGTLPPMTTMHPPNATAPPPLNGTTMAAGTPGPLNGTLPPMTTMHPLNGTVPPMINGTIGTPGPLNGTLPPMTTTHPMNGTVPPMLTGTPGPLNATLPPMTTVHPMNGTVPPMINGTTMVAGTPGPFTLPPMTTMHSMNGTVPPLLNGTTMIAGTTPKPIGTMPPLNGTLPPPMLPTLHSANSTVPPLLNATISPMATKASGPLAVTMAPVSLSVPNGTVSPPTDPYCSSDTALEIAGECYLALTSLSSTMADMTPANMMDQDFMDNLNSYCSTFQTCFISLERCGDFNDTKTTNMILDFCSYYQFWTTPQVKKCTDNADFIFADTPCLMQANEAILDFNKTDFSRCFTLSTVNSCANKEIQGLCKPRPQQLYQMFINRFIQKWAC